MYEIFVETHFSAAHRLSKYPGDCSRWHGHNWVVTAFVQAEELNELGMAADFREIKEALCALVDKLDHRDLTDIPEFADRNPTCEVIAQHLYSGLSNQLRSRGLGSLKVARVTVRETPTAGATYFE